ncbi:MAG TPA: Ig-like domain-containing protein [Gemmatimonadaceae bacterium]
MSLLHRQARVSLPLIAFTLAACGGGEPTTGPRPVARVDVTAPSSVMDVGETMQLTVRYYDAQSAQLTGRTVTYSSSNVSIATVTPSGAVTSVAVGAVTVRATVDGEDGTLAITVVRPPVVTMVITPTNPSVKEGETITLAAQPYDPSGNLLTDRVVTWASADPARASVSNVGLVTGITPGYVYIRASADTKTDSVNLRVRALNAPSITGGPAGELVPGANGTITGVHFGPGIPDNAVFVNGAQASVTAASATSVDFVVPSIAQLPCTATGPAQIMLVANGDTAFATAGLRVATARQLAVGASLLLTSQADLICNEFEGNGGRYLITAFNYATNAGTRVSFRLPGSAQPAVGAVPAASEEPLPVPRVPASALLDDAAGRHLRGHATLMAQERDLARKLGRPHLKRRAAERRRADVPANLAAPQPPPNVGDNLSYRMRQTLGSFSDYDEVDFRVVYSGTKLVILEDATAPLAGTMDQEYVKLGEEFDQVMYDLLLTFGDPLVVDSALDNNGRLLALFSPRVNNYEVNGVSNQILGFVTICDFFPRVPVTLDDGTVIPACPVSNEGEVFYALVPDPAAGWSISFWRRLIRSTLIHEAKHITSYAWRYYYDASELEEIWLEEATAQVASEMWARTIYQRGQGQDIGWDEGPHCDYAPESGACPDPAEAILHHFSFLYSHYAASETKSILNDPSGAVDPVVYGSSWSFVRYVTDAYAANESQLLGALVQVQNDRGVANIAGKTGKPFSELLGMWSLASLADNYPGATVADPRLQLPSWNSRDLFQNMSRNVRGEGGSVIFPAEWPLQVRQVQFGTFTSARSDVNSLRGGSFVAWELSGAQLGPQALAIRSLTGGVPPNFIGMAIVRIQ